jgi:hypothetical protein
LVLQLVWLTFSSDNIFVEQQLVAPYAMVLSVEYVKCWHKKKEERKREEERTERKEERKRAKG